MHEVARIEFQGRDNFNGFDPSHTCAEARQAMQRPQGSDCRAASASFAARQAAFSAALLLSLRVRRVASKSEAVTTAVLVFVVVVSDGVVSDAAQPACSSARPGTCIVKRERGCGQTGNRFQAGNIHYNYPYLRCLCKVRKPNFSNIIIQT